MLSGAAADASFPGRDGRIAFDSAVTPSGVRGLVSVAPDGRGLQAIGGLIAMSPAWSADGKRLAFSSLTPGGGSYGALFTSTATGAGLRKLAASCGRGAPTVVCGGILKYPSWAPDGRRLAFVNLIGGRDCPPSDVYGCLPTTPRSALEVIDSDGSHRRALFTSSDPLLGRPAWSPDGRTIVYAQPNPAGGGSCVGTGLWTVRPDGTHRRQLIGSCRPGLRDASSPDWSPDGRHIAFSAQSRTVYRRCAYAGRQQLVNCQEVPTPPHQYGVGQFIFRDDVVDIFVADPAGGHVHRVTHNLLWPIRCLGNPTPCAEGHHDAESPSWSPDGSTIAYAAKGIWTVSAAGGHQVEVAVATGAGGTAWQPRRQ